MKFFTILIAVLALGLPLALWATSAQRSGLFTDRSDEAGATLAAAPAAASRYAR